MIVTTTIISRIPISNPILIPNLKILNKFVMIFQIGQRLPCYIITTPATI